MQRSHKIELCPNNKQRTYFKKACGVARFVWNWALADWEEQYKLYKEKGGISPSGLSLKKQLNAIKKEQYPWMLEVTKYAAQQPFIHLQQAFREFFKKTRSYPRFKKKGKSKDSFYIGGDQIKVQRKAVWIPRLGWVRMREELRFGGRIQGVTISRLADRWYISFCVDVYCSILPCKNQTRVGIDLGINHLMTLSTGEKVSGVKPLKKLLRRIKRYQRQLSKSKGLRNKYRLRMKLARLYRKISNIRQDQLHKLTSYLTTNFKYVAIEDLNVKGMLTNSKLARHIADMGFYEFKRQLLYKANDKLCAVFLADRWYPSSKTCSKCKTLKKDLLLKDRVFKCHSCNFEIDRDLNAALNLEHLLFTESSSESYECGQDGNGVWLWQCANQPG